MYTIYIYDIYIYIDRWYTLNSKSKPIYFANDDASNLWRKKGVVTSLGAGALGSHRLLSRRRSPWKIPKRWDSNGAPNDGCRNLELKMLLKILVSDGYNWLLMCKSWCVIEVLGKMSLVAIELNTGAPPRLQTYYLNWTRIDHLQLWNNVQNNPFIS